MTWPSLFTQSVILSRLKPRNLSLIYQNFMRSFKKPYSCPKNIVKFPQTGTKCLLQTLKLVIKLLLRLNFSGPPDHLKNSQKNTLVLTKSLHKQGHYLGPCIFQIVCEQYTLSFMVQCLSPLYLILFLIDIKLHLLQWLLTANQNMKFLKFWILNSIIGNMSASCYTYSNGPVMKGLMKKLLGY